MSKNRTMRLDELPGFIQEMVTTGHTISAVVKKGRKIVARMDFKTQDYDEKNEVRIPCIIVPRSPFHKEKA